ncbi:MAG: response regulator transcription factor [Desulfobulbaceae bacterium]|nr:response regulator transcription factor [Desulfobulbaceae bacterium]
MRILLVHGDNAVQSAYSNALAKFGFVEIADNGRDGVLLFVNSCKAGNRYDLLVIDQNLKILNGEGTVAKVRSYESEHLGPGKRVLIVFSSNNLHLKSTSDDGPMGVDERIIFQGSPVDINTLESIAEKVVVENAMKVLPRLPRYGRQINMLA